MDLKQLQSKGGFVSSVPVPTEVEWTRIDEATGEVVTDTFTVHVLRKAVGWMDRAYRIAAGATEHSRTAAVIAEGVRFGKNGEEQMSYEQAAALDLSLANALLDAFNRVNRRDFDPKNLQQKTSSGASSSSAESVDAP